MSDTETQDRVNPFEIFDAKYREDVIGLTYIGHLQKEIRFCGHTFVLRTLRPAEKSAIAVAIKDYTESGVWGEVWQNAHVAVALVSIDGDDEFCPPAAPDLTRFVEARLRYVTDAQTGWFQPTLDYLFGQYLELEKDVTRAIGEFENLGLGSQ